MRPDRDDPLGPAIRRALQDSRTDCPDAEALAAYADRLLGTAERRDVERHLSGCARCRETLLLMSRAADAETPAPSRPRFLVYRWPWLAGAAAAALAIIVWTTSGQRELELQAPRAGDAVQQMAREAGRDAGQDKAPASPDSKLAKSPSAAAAPAVPRARESRPRGLADASTKRRSDEPKEEQAGARHAEAQAPAAAPAPPAAPVPPAPPRTAAEALAKEAPAARDAAERNFRARQNSEYVIASWPPVPANASAVRPAITWRVWASGVVERSTDGGATWARETDVDAPAARAIHVPSRDVCWIVGDGGLILRYDTGRWTRLPPPSQVGFVAVEASDALRATITSSDGRRFTTTDGGLTWK